MRTGDHSDPEWVGNVYFGGFDSSEISLKISRVRSLGNPASNTEPAWPKFGYYTRCVVTKVTFSTCERTSPCSVLSLDMRGYEI